MDNTTVQYELLKDYKSPFFNAKKGTIGVGNGMGYFEFISEEGRKFSYSEKSILLKPEWFRKVEQPKSDFDNMWEDLLQKVDKRDSMRYGLFSHPAIKFYTEKDLEDCFNAARETWGKIHGLPFGFHTFQDYIKSKTKL